jgi:hypothetical protein
LELVENANDSFCLTWWKEPTSQVDYATFFFFVELFEHVNDSFCLTWWKEQASQVDCATFYLRGKLCMIHVTNPTIGVVGLINKEAWVLVIDFVRKQCSTTTTCLIVKVES